jgi:hypothetical protein
MGVKEERQLHWTGNVAAIVESEGDGEGGTSSENKPANTKVLQETLNYWKQLPHILKYFRADEEPKARLPKNFMSGFLEVQCSFLQKSHQLISFQGRN